MYELIKQAHFIAIFIWILSMLIALFSLKIGASGSFSRVLRGIMSIGISFTWLLGAYMAYFGGHYVSLWFWAKVIIVFGLSGLHGKIAGQLRKNQHINSYTSVISMSVITLLTVVLVLYLALLKPF